MADDTDTAGTEDRIAHYRVLRKLGEGGMGVVFAARDERLDRMVAIKRIRGGGNAADRQRLWREARSLASINHPNVCQLYETGEYGGELFLAMELLEGESLAQRLARGALPIAEAVRTAIAILDPLETLHGRGLLHRDLKPSNVFLTPRGVKLLDFGLARPMLPDAADAQITATGMVMGTPHYLSPEQLHGQAVDGRSDLFGVAAMLYEMLAGRRAFDGGSVMEVFHAVLHQDPPTLLGSAGVAGVDQVLRRALAKDPAQRFATASAMAEDLRAALATVEAGEVVAGVRSLRRLIVLPFRVLRPDPETDFLASSLPDAIAGSLSNLEALVVRPSLMAARLADLTDLGEIAARADVDVVLTGTLLRAGGRLRVAAQLAETRHGAVVWSDTTEAPLGDAFQLQDAITRHIVESLAVPLSPRDRQALRSDAPADPRAYELFLRANHLATQGSEREAARRLYLQCLERDPNFAPAWAHLGRVERVLAQFSGARAVEHYASAQEAFRRALELHPDLSIAHHLYTHVEVDLGRALDAMVRLLGRAARRPADAELFAGITHTSRYCGLLHASIAAHARAVRLDPTIRTSVNHAYFALGDHPRAIETNREDPPVINAFSLDLLGRAHEAVAMLRAVEAHPMPAVARTFVSSMRLAIEGEGESCLAVIDENAAALAGFRDPCGLYYIARVLARAGDVPRGLEFLGRSVGAGYACPDLLQRDPWLASLRAEPAHAVLVLQATRAREAARQAFFAAGGDRLLQVTQP